MDDFWLIEDEPVAERRVVVTPDESATDGTNAAESADDGSLGLCRRCGKGTAYLIRFSDGSTEVRCDRCFGHTSITGYLGRGRAYRRG